MRAVARTIITAAFVVAISVGYGNATTAQAGTAVIVVLRDGYAPSTVAAEHATRYGAQVSFVYTAALNGYAARVPSQSLAGLASDPRVAFVSEDREVQAVAKTGPTGGGNGKSIATTLVISPHNATIPAGGNQAYAATAYDQRGHSMGDVTSGTTFTASSGASCTGNQCGSGTAGTYTITGTYQGIQDTATLTVSSAPPVLTTITVTPASASVVVGSSANFTASGYDQFGNATSTTPTWSSDPSAGCTAGPSTSTTCAPSAAGTYTVTATDGSVSGSATLVANAPAPSGDTAPTGIRRISATTSTTFSAPAIAVIDTGSGPHPDLNIAGGHNCSTGTSYDDGNGHGTHVAGTIAAKINGSGVVGVVPGAPIYSVRVLNDSGRGTWSSVACGIDWVTANAASLGIKVASMSLGGSGSDGSCSSDALHLAICNSVAAGVTYVVAAGNSAADFQGFVPAAYDQVLTVTAMSDSDGAPGGTGGAPTCRTGEGDDVPATFSNYATLASDQAHTIAAPGVCILSDWTGGGYNTISGTSMATPHVSGAVARCIASGACAGLGPAQIVLKMRSDAAAMPSGYGFTGSPSSGSQYYGYLVKGSY